MKSIKRRLLSGLLLSTLWAASAHAQNRYIVRSNGGLAAVRLVCTQLGCSVAGGLDGSLGQVFLVTTSSTVPATTFLDKLVRQLGIVDAELDLTASVSDSGYTVPPALTDSAPVD